MSTSKLFAKLFTYCFLLLALVLSRYCEAVSAEYEKGIVGSVNSVGSDTLDKLLTAWANEFNDRYPHARFQIQTAGSSAAPPAITSGTANIGPMSRPLFQSERNAFVQRFGYEPTLLQVAIDAIAVFVHRDNPLSKISMTELDAVYSATRYCGAKAPILQWNALLTTNETPLLKADIAAYGRSSASGTYNFFKRTALCAGYFNSSIKQQLSSEAVAQSVANNPNAIGYASFGYLNNQLKILDIESEEKITNLTAQTVQSGEYPFSRNLYILVNIPDKKPIENTLRRFLEFILSKDGQNIAVEQGYINLSQKHLDSQLRILNTASRYRPQPLN